MTTLAPFEPTRLIRDDASEDRWTLNFGPQHPATHTTLQLVLELEGERVVNCTPHIGYLHSGFEKLGEHLNYNQYVVVTDRMNYISPIVNNLAWHAACEKLFGIELTPRCKAIRTICAELGRIQDHLLCVGAATPGELDAARAAIPASLAGRARLIGRQPRERVPLYLALGDILVSPRSYGDNFPLKLFDYLAMGKPILATRIKAHTCVLDERIAKLATPSAEGLAAAMLELLQRPEEQRRLGSAAADFARRELSVGRKPPAKHAFPLPLRHRCGWVLDLELRGRTVQLREPQPTELDQRRRHPLL